MVVNVSDLQAADPAAWRNAADDAVAAAKQCDLIGAYARDEVASTLEQCWVGDTGTAARTRFVKHADDFEAAKRVLNKLAETYDGLADDITTAQRNLNSALDYARKHGLSWDDSGRLQSEVPVLSPPGPDESDEPLRHAQPLIDEALAKANEADSAAAVMLRTIENLTHVSDPDTVAEALNTTSPISIAMRLSGGLDGLHSINVPPHVLASVDRAATETGISRRLLLAILWQEQQWYQNFNPSLKGPVASFGRFFNWTLAETLKPDKSLGITHIKLDTAREVLETYKEVFVLPNGNYVKEFDDAELAKYIEVNPGEAVRMSAYHLLDIRKDSSYGAEGDKELLILYAADTPAVRESNEMYGEDSDERGGAIKPRGKAYDDILPHIDDAILWNNLSERERQNALQQLEDQLESGERAAIDPIFGPDAIAEKAPTEPAPIPPAESRRPDAVPSPSPGPAPHPLETG
ncbi:MULTISPECIES: hypothetical protein [Streptomyces]|uniref:hypothetical protein n=1 Tax=Streptomyces TaxID=1883 RepID=UPI002248B302|nr:hypothetical protein [Streptomyces sp. JHD 1]MCX2971071.1 hypothetical protein [Streptomyces sp. JHD 1]